MMSDLIVGARAVSVMVCLLGVPVTSLDRHTPQEISVGQVFQWDRLVSAYDAYIECPILGNAEILIAALPIDRSSKMKGDAAQAFEHMFSADYYPVLYEEAISGVKEAVEIHFRLLNIADGFMSEIVSSTLGVILRNHPRLFLQLLNNYKNTKEVRTWGYPIDFIGSGHNMHPKAALHILEKRIEALETVEDADLKDLRDACVAQLRRSVKLRAR
jgi:hypothetical protein